MPCRCLIFVIVPILHQEVRKLRLKELDIYGLSIST